MAERLKSLYFRHDENAAMDIKLMALRSQLAMEGYGIYWFLIEQLSLAGGKMPLKMIPMLAQIMQTTPDKAMSVVRSYDLFTEDENGFFSERLNKELEKRGTLSEVAKRAGLASAQKRAEKALIGHDVQRPLEIRSTPVQPLEKRIEEDRIEKDRREEVNQLSVGDLQTRQESFLKEINECGSEKYVKRMLNEFYNHWSETNPRHKKPKMRFEMQKTFEIPNRLSTWARKVTEYEAFLSEAEKTIVHKKHAFAVSLEAYLSKYSREQLNSFYLYWAQPENKKDSQRLRFELEPAWELGPRLMKWAENNPTKQ